MIRRSNILSLQATSYRWGWPFLFLLLLLLGLFLVFSVYYRVPREVAGLGILLVQGELTEITSLSDATLDSWVVEEGDVLSKGHIIARIRSLDGELAEIRAPHGGSMAEIIAYPGTQVKKGESLALLAPLGDVRHHLELIGFVSSLEGKKVNAGMKARIWPSVTSSYHDGALLARVKHVGKLPMTKAAVQSIIKIPGLAKYIRNKIEAEPFLVVLALDKDDQQPSGYRWSKVGPSFELDSGIIADFDIIYDEQSLLARMFPAFERWRMSFRSAL
jgi:hypothetical protein